MTNFTAKYIFHMLKKASLIILVLLSSFAVQAQYKPILFGFRGAGNLSWMKSSDEAYVNEGMKPGGTWGFIAEFFLMENYAILTGFNVNYLGGKLTYPDALKIGQDVNFTVGTTSRRYFLQFVEVPLVLKMQAKVQGNIKAFGKVGLGTSFRLKARSNDTFNYDSGSVTDDKKNIEGDISLVYESLILGMGAEIALHESTSLIVDLTFNNGLTDILKGSNPVNPEKEQKGILSYLQLGVGIVF
jgi:hypothetical protein